MPKPTYNPKNDRRRFDEIMSREPGSRLSDDDLFVFENEINRRREQAARNELYDQYRRETAAVNAVPGGLDAPAIERARTRNIQAGPQLVPKSRNERSRYSGEKKPSSQNERSQAARKIGPGGGRPRFDRVISGGVDSSLAQLTNLGGAAIEGVGVRAETGIKSRNDQARRENERALQSLQEQLERARSEEDRQRIRERMERTRRDLMLLDEDYARQQRQVLTEKAAPVYAKADELQSASAENIEAAREGLGGLGRLAVDAGVAGVQMLGDAAANMLLPGSGLAMLGARSMGGGMQEARQAGADYDQQLKYGAAEAAKEVLTEKMFGVFENVYGKGILDDSKLVKGLSGALDKMRLTPAGRTVLAWLGNGGEEATEELVGDIFDPLISTIYNGKSALQNYSEMELSDVLHDALVGGVLGLLGGNSQVMANAAETASYSDVYGPDSAALVQETLDIDPENKTAQRARERLQEGREVPARMLRRMVEENEARIQETGAEQDTGEADSRGPVDLKMTEDAGEIGEEKNRLPRGSVPRNDAEADFLTQRAREFGDAAQDFMEARQSGQDPETYYSGFQAAYLYGKANSGTTGQIDTDTREELRQATGLTDGQIDLAYNLGRAEVNRQERTDPRGVASLGMTEEGAEQYGAEQAEGVRVRDGGQRFDGTDPRGPAEAVAEGTGGTEVRQTQGRAADRGAAAFTYAREGRSTAQLIGGSRGSSTDSLRVVTGGKSASIQQAEQIVKERGLTPHLFAGGNLTVTNSGKTVKARGFIHGKNVFVRADDPHFTADQIARHEVGHDMIAGGEIDVEEVRKRLREKFTQKEMDAVAELYADLYAGSGLSEAEIWEEIICDSLGDMNVFEDTWAAEKAPVDAVLREAKTEAVRQQENDRGPPNGQKNTAQNEGGKMSFVRATDSEFRRADIMEKNGVSEEEIWKETGMIRDAAGNWVTEINDREARYYPNGDAQFRADHPEYARYQDLVEKFIAGSITENEMAEMQELRPTWSQEQKRLAERVQRGNATLGNVLQHDELFKRIPALRDVPFRIVEELGSWGQRGGDGIALSEELDAALRKGTVLHEVQHEIQHQEERPGGANEEYWQDRIDRKTAPRTNDSKIRDAEARRDAAWEQMDEATRRQVRAINRESLKAQETGDFANWEQMDEALRNSEHGDLYEAYDDAMFDLRTATEYNREMTASELYRNTAGEIEARLTESRRDMTDEQRKGRVPDFQRNKAVFAGKVGTSFDYIEGTVKEETIRDGIQDIARMTSVYDVTGDEFAKGSEDLVTQVGKYFAKFNNSVYNQQLGDVMMTERGVKDDIGHGMGRKKAASYAALPAVIEKGKVVDYQINWNGRNYDTAVVVAPVTIGGEPYLEGVILIRTNKQNRFYVHEVLTEKDKGAPSFKTGGSPEAGASTGGDAPSLLNILRSVLDVKRNILEQQDKKTGKTSAASDSLESLRQENEELRKAFAEQQRQLRKTEKKLADTRENRDNWRNKATFHPERVARDIIRAYEGTVKETEIHDGVKALIDYAARKEGVSFDKMKEMALPVAQQIVSSAETVVNGEEARTWADIKKYHKDHKIRVSTEALRDFADWGDADTDFKTEFRKKYGRPLNLTSGQEGVPIDVAYAEMAEMFGEVYYPSDITHPADQLRRMAEVRENLQPVMENPYSLNMAMATEHCANELVDTVMRAVALGYGNTYGGRMAEQLYQARQDSRRMLEQERQRSADQMKALKDHWKEQKAHEFERRQDSEERDRLLKIARRMQNKKLPTVQRGLIDQYIKDLDTVSRKLTGKTIYDLVSLEHWYQERKQNDPDFIPDEATEKRIHRLYERHVDDLSREEVLDLTYALLNIENQIKTEKDLIESREKRDIFEAGLAVMRNIENSPGSKASGVRSAIDRLVVTETLSPLRQVRRMTGYVDGDPLVTLTDELAAGQRAMFDYQRRALDRFKAFVEDKAFTKEITGKDAREIEIRGLGKDGPVTVKITPAMRISLYLHSKNPQNLQHIAGGGIRVPDMKLYKQGKIQEAYARGTVIKLTPSEVRAIVGQMTVRERRFADVAHDYFNSTSKEAINAVSEKLKGYPVAEVENYFPISTDDSFTRKDFESIKFDGSIEGMGFLKERVKSSSPVYLRDLNSVLTQAIDMHAKYVGLAVPVRNFNKLWGVTAHNVTENGDLGASSSVQSTVRQQWGEDGRRYIEKMMSDLQQGGREQSVYARELSKVRSAYAGAVLTLNASVAMKQAASYPTAAAVVGWKPLMAAMKNVGKVDLDLIAAYTPLQWYRSRGFSTQELGDMAKRGKQLLPALNWVQGADLLTTRKLWKAAEIYVRDNFKTLERGSAEEIRTGKSPFYQKVAEVYNRIIEETQPNYTTMQRPQLLRSDDTLLQNLQMFKTQPFQNFNILYDALGNLAAKERAWKSSQTEESWAALREAKRNAAWAVSSQAVQLAVFAAMTLAWNAFRGKRDKYEDKEGDVSFLSVLKGLGLDMVSGLFSEIPFGGDAWALGTSMVTGGKYYGVTDVTTSALTDAGTALVKAGKTVSGLLKDIFDPNKEPDFNGVRLKLDSVADAVSKAFGWPYENVLNLGKALFRHGAKWLEGDYMGQYRYLQLTTDPGGSYKGDYYDLLWQAYRKDMEAHRTLYRQMVADGWDPDNIKNEMEKRMKDEQGVRSVKDLKSRYQAP